MRVTLFFLLATLSTASALSAFRFPFTWSGMWSSLGFSSLSKGEECRCTSSVVSLERKLELVAEDNDHDKNGLVTFDDLYYDVSNHFDANKDGLLSEGECVDHFSCRYGDSDQFATYFCAVIMGGNDDINYAQVYNVEPFVSGIDLQSFVGVARSRYENFFNFKCMNRDSSLDEKIERNAANNDFNNDGQVTPADLKYDLDNFYDTDKDEVITQAEFVVRWVCNYGTSSDFARFFWQTFSGGSNTITVAALSALVPPEGVPLDAWKSSVRQVFADYANRDVSGYLQSRS